MILTVKDFKEALRKIKENPENHGLSHEEYQRVMEMQQELKESTRVINASIQKISDAFAKAAAAFQSSAIKIEEKLREIRFVANHDWLISFNIFADTALPEMIEIISKKNKEDFEDFVMSAFPQSQDSIFDGIRKSLPNRRAILDEIEQSYIHGFYFSTITLCYTQVDGICNEKFEYGFFDTNAKTHDLKIGA
jgi:hypothetical protein